MAENYVHRARDNMLEVLHEWLKTQKNNSTHVSHFNDDIRHVRLI